MKSSVILATACATLALAAVKTEIVTAVVTVTVTGSGPSPTAAAPAAVETPENPETPETPTGSSGAGAFFSNGGGSSNDETTAQSPAPAAPQTQSVDTSNLSGYAAPILAAHNKARAQHSAPALEWDDNLAAIAQQIGETCVYDHNTIMGGGGYGQNIAAGAAANSIDDVIYNAMYQEESVYYTAYGGEPDISTLGKWGHFSQIVWVGTQRVGCATVTCGALGNAPGMAPIFTVCNYQPTGNMIGSFAENVLPN